MPVADSEAGRRGVASWRQVPVAASGIYYGWVIVGVLGLTTIFSYGSNQYLFGVLIVPVSRDFHSGRAVLSGGFAASILLAGLAGIPVGRWIDQHGARAVLSIGSAVSGLSLLVLSRATTTTSFAIIWIVGFGLSAALTYYPVSFTVVTGWFHTRRGAALAILSLLGGLASPLFIPLVGILIPDVGWRTTVLLLGVVQIIVIAPLNARVLRHRPEDLGLCPDVEVRQDSFNILPAAQSGVAAALHQRAFWWLTVSMAVATFGTSVVLTHQIAYLIGRGYSPKLSAGIAGALGVASLPGRYVLTALSDRFAPEFVLSASLALLGCGVLVLLYAGNLLLLTIYVVVYGAAFGAVSPLRAAVMAERFGQRAFGTITATQGVPIALLAGLGPLGAGWLYDQQHSYSLAFGLSAASLLLASLGVACLSRG